MKALILAGGFATRLRPLSCTRPKSLLPILNRPLLQWTFKRLAENRIDEAVLAVNYQTEIAIKQHSIPKHGVHVRYSRDPLKKPLGTGGPIKKAEKHIGRNAFLVLNGDIFADVNYTEILEMHKKKKAIATIALHQVEDPGRYGVAELAKDNRIKRFIEKPAGNATPSKLINAGVYVLSPEIFERLPKGQAVSIEREVFPKLAEEKALYGYVFDGLWIDIGKPEDYLQANRVMLDSSVDEQKPKIRYKTRIRNPVALDKGVTVGKDSVIGPYAVLGRDVSVGKSVHILNSIVLPRTVISDFSSIEGAIIGEGASIGREVKITKGCILADRVKIEDNITLAEEVSVCPAKVVSENVLTSKNIC